MTVNSTYLAMIQKGIEYIEENLDGNIRPQDVAQSAGISQWHFQRIFKALTNETLKTYIRSRWLSEAMRHLLYSNMRILDIALESGFESQESFTRAFKTLYDITPNQFRKLGEKNRFLNKVTFNTEYLKHINKNIQLEPSIVQKGLRIMVGIKTNFYGIDSEKNNFADKLSPLWNEFLPRIVEIPNRLNDQAFGVIQTKKNTDLLEYSACCEVSKIDENLIPERMTCLVVPSAAYATFKHKGNIKNINDTINYIYSSWLLQSKYWHTYGPDIETYDQQFIPNSDSSVMSYSIPVMQ